MPKRYCRICDRKAEPGQRGFVLAQDECTDMLSIFHWQDSASVHYACCPAHVRELVIHWMVTGNLNYPFAEALPRLRAAIQDPMPLRDGKGSERGLAVPIGELAVDRDAVQRILGENPAGLEVILEELNDALEKSIEEPPEGSMLAELLDSFPPHI